MGTHLAELVAVRAAGQCQAYVLEGHGQTAGGPGRPDQARQTLWAKAEHLEAPEV